MTLPTYLLTNTKDFYSTFHFLLIISILFFAFTVEKLNTDGNP